MNPLNQKTTLQLNKSVILALVLALAVLLISPPAAVEAQEPGVFSDSGQSLGGSDSVDAALGDVDGDGDLDAFVANSLQSNQVWLNDGTGAFSDSGQSMGSSNSLGMAMGDVDGDGDLDAFVANFSYQPDKVWLNDGAGAFSDSGQSLGSSKSRDLALGDVDGDGDLDAFVANSADGPNKVWLNQSPPPVTTTLAVAPASSEIYVGGDTLAVDLNIENVADLYAAQATCTVDPAILEPQAGVFGDFFNSTLRLTPANEVDAAAGTWFGAISQQRPAEALAGDGLLATLTYEALNPGTTSLTCEALFSDRDGFEIPVSVSGAEVTVLAFGSISGTVTYQGRLEHAGIEVTATGPVTRTAVTDNAGDFALGQLKLGSYDVTADADLYLPSCTTATVSSGETVTLDETTLAGGDLNDNGVIDIGDVTLLTGNFGLSTPPGDPQADINVDGVVDARDLAILAGNYELSGCQGW